MNARHEFMKRIRSELERAYAKHGAEPWTRHEFYAILLEEVDELWADIKADAPQEQLEKEIVQVAAMCFRFMETGAGVGAVTTRVIREQFPVGARVETTENCLGFDGAPMRGTVIGHMRSAVEFVDDDGGVWRMSPPSLCVIPQDGAA